MISVLKVRPQSVVLSVLTEVRSDSSTMGTQLVLHAGPGDFIKLILFYPLMTDTINFI